MEKLSQLNGDKWVEHSYPPVFMESKTKSAAKRILAGVPGGDWLPFERLALTLEPPLILLYVLHTPRGEGQPGRYQSEEVSGAELQNFLERFGTYLSSDSRFDLWAYSPDEDAKIVWDRHNLLFAYGPTERFAVKLRELGFGVGQAKVPDPHLHHYRPEFDKQAADLLGALKWTRSPLKPEDEQ